MNPAKPILVALWMAVSACNGGGEEQEPACPALEEALSEAVVEWGDKEEIPGAILAVKVAGCRSWIGTTGLALLRPKTPMRNDNLFSIWSVTKTFTAAVILQMVEEGTLSLEDPISNWFDYIPDGDVITVRMLLNHTSGLYNYTDSPEFNADLEAAGSDWIIEPRELIDYALAESPTFAPGEGWYYCNTGFILLGMIIEEVSGRRISEVIRERLLEPLDLKNTFFDGEEEIIGDLAHEYALDGTDLTYRFHPSWGWSAGAMVSDAADLLAWLKALFEAQVFSRSLLDQMMTMTEIDYIPGAAYGLGLWIKETETAGLIWGHDGHGQGSQVELYYNPQLDSIMLAFVNCYLFDCIGGGWNLFYEGAIPAIQAHM